MLLATRRMSYALLKCSVFLQCMLHLNGLCPSMPSLPRREALRSLISFMPAAVPAQPFSGQFTTFNLFFFLDKAHSGLATLKTDKNLVEITGDISFMFRACILFVSVLIISHRDHSAPPEQRLHLIFSPERQSHLCSGIYT